VTWYGHFIIYTYPVNIPQRLKGQIRATRFIVRIANLGLAGYTLYTQAFSFFTYSQTSSETSDAPSASSNSTINAPPSPNSTLTTQPHTLSPWPAQPELWPTYMMLAFSVVSASVALATICAYICSGRSPESKDKRFKRANFIDSKVGLAATIFEAVGHMALWITAAVSYRVASNGNDLWGWTCSDAADAVADVFQNINFDNLCIHLVSYHFFQKQF
jgi:hypothetical protein